MRKILYKEKKMKLTIGENIRNYRRKNDITQETLADRLGVTYQSVSRWENGTTYPDIELLPAIAEVLAVTIDELLGMSQIEKEKRAEETFDELRRECIKQDYDADRIVELLQDIRRNYLNSESAWRPWVEGNNRAFSDPEILPEVRLFAEEYLEKHPMFPHTIKTMAAIETEENLKEFMSKNTTSFDCSERALLFNRYLTNGDVQRFETERRYQLYDALRNILCPHYLRNWEASIEHKNNADEFMSSILSVIRCGAADERPDMWTEDRIELGLKSAMRAVSKSEHEYAISEIEKAVSLLEETMKITDETAIPTSCPFLDGMEWFAEESWLNRNNDPDGDLERNICISSSIRSSNGSVGLGYLVDPKGYLCWLQQKTEFDPIRNNPKFESLCDRVKALIQIRQKAK